MSRNKRQGWTLFAVVALAALAMYLWNRGNDQGVTLSDEALTDFAIEDTASIGQFSIEDDLGRKVVLKRGTDGVWSLNDLYMAQPHLVNLLLRTFKNVGIQSPVANSQREMAMRVILGDVRKVRILDREGEWIKTWHVGRATPNSQGTYALVETAKDGLSTDPFIIEYRGFRGYLTSRFHARIDDWRSTQVFRHPNLDMKSIKVITPKDPSRGFEIEVENFLDGQFRLLDYQGVEQVMIKTEVMDYIAQYEAINLENFKPDLSPEGSDSLLALPPDFRFVVEDKGGNVTSVDMYLRPTPASLKARMENAPAIDPERVYVHFKDDLAMGQRLTFDRIIGTVDDLRVADVETP